MSKDLPKGAEELRRYGDHHFENLYVKGDNVFVKTDNGFETLDKHRESHFLYVKALDIDGVEVKVFCAYEPLPKFND
jgi:hypothetical protein